MQQSEEDIQMQLILEKSKVEAEHDALMRKKNEELLNLMQKMEEDKPEGWGFDKKIEGKSGEEFEAYQHNLSKALKKLEINDKIESHK